MLIFMTKVEQSLQDNVSYLAIKQPHVQTIFFLTPCTGYLEI